MVDMGVKLTKIRTTREERSCTTAIDNLPVEILRLIFSYVPSRDLVVKCSRVCNEWHGLINDDVFWRRRCDAAGVVYPTNFTEHNDNKLLDYQRLYFFRPFCRNLVKNWNAAGNVVTSPK